MLAHCFTVFDCYIILMQNVDYFQVVLRKAQHLREQALKIAKSSVGQDHSYVRSDHDAQPTATSFDGLEALIKAISYREAEADILNGK